MSMCKYLLCLYISIHVRISIENNGSWSNFSLKWSPANSCTWPAPGPPSCELAHQDGTSTIVHTTYCTNLTTWQVKKCQSETQDEDASTMNYSLTTNQPA